MPAERVTMRKIKDILRLKWACGLSNRQVAASCGVARSTVAETLYRATAAGLAWPLPAELDDAQLETRLYPAAPSPTAAPRAVPDWATLHQELARKGVTLALLWQEYKAQHLTAISTAASVSSMGPGVIPWTLPPPRAPGWGEAVRRLHGPDRAGPRPAHRRDPAGPDLRRGVERVELYLRRGDLDPNTARLDRGPRAGLRLLRRRAADHGPQQSPRGCDQGLSV